jgi:hypothetical protein
MDEEYIMYLRIEYAFHFQSHTKRMDIEDARAYFAYLLRTPTAVDRSRRIENLNSYIEAYESANPGA